MYGRAVGHRADTLLIAIYYQSLPEIHARNIKTHSIMSGEPVWILAL